jgi:hypothetical protein
MTAFSTFGKKLVQLPGMTTLLTMIGVLGPANGGTGISTYTTGDTLYASSANVLSKLAIGTNGHFLKVVAGIPAWAAISGSITSVSQQTFVADGTYTPTTGTAYCLAIVQAAGGNGGNATGSTSAAGGGGGGGASIGLFAVASLTGQSVDVGTTAGSSSSIGAVISATGGGAGANDTSSGAVTLVIGGSAGVGSGGQVNINGMPGSAPTKSGTASNNMVGGNGGSSLLGGGGLGRLAGTDVAGNNGGNYGGGGAGGAANGATDRNGGTGAPGIVYIIEFIS